MTGNLVGTLLAKRSFSYKHCNFSLGCLLVKVASKTVTRSVYLTTVEGLVRGNPWDEKKVPITGAGRLRE